jgi:GNAT superfamily N-acetyltransferase
MAPTIKIRSLKPTDDRTQFASGDVELDRFFKSYAGQNQFKHHLGTTYVAEIEGGIISGYVTVSAGHIETERLTVKIKKKLPNYPLPILRIARLAIDEKYKGQGIGQTLLRSMLELAVKMNDEIGCVGVVVDAKVKAVPFYQKYGFILIEVEVGNLNQKPTPQPMFLSISSIIRAMS